MSGKDSMKSVYRKHVSRKILFIIIFAIICVIAFGLELAMGALNIGFFESFQVLFDHLKGIIPEPGFETTKDYTIWELRVPRAIAGLAVGAGLGVCGAAMQSALKNPLADPYTTGISSGAALGAALSIIMGICVIPGITGSVAVVINAFVLSLIPAGVIIAVSVMKKSASSTSMILIGIAVMYIFSAMTSLMMLYANSENLAEVYIWNVGTLGKATWDNISFLVAGALIAVILLIALSNKLNILSMKDNNIISLGEDPKKLRIIFLVIVSLVTALLVSFTGSIGFVGLVAPHMVRTFIGSDNRYLIPASAVFGGAFLLLADCVAKSVGSTGLPVGVITALVGGPLFILILIKQRRNAWD